MTPPSIDATRGPPYDIALAHWGEHVNGGGDRVAWELARVFSDTPLYVGWRDRSIEPDDVRVEQLIDSPVSEWALRSGGVPQMVAHLIGWQIASQLRDHDVLVTSGNEPLFYVPPTEQVWIAYVHHTNRRQSDQIDEVGDGPLAPAKLVLYYLIRVLFDHNTHKPDRYVANSEIIKRRMVRYWGIDKAKISVVYPPVDTHNYAPEDAETDSYYLTLSRLDWHKSVDGILEAFRQHDDKRLVVAGDGPSREHLESVAGDNVEFRGYVDEREKRALLAGAKGFVFNARDEDFGISPVEAMAAGTPVLGVGEGMTQFQVVDGKNGYVHMRTPKDGPSLVKTIDRFEADGVDWTAEEIAAFADRFSVAAFHRRMKEVVSKTVENVSFAPDWYASLTDEDPERPG